MIDVFFPFDKEFEAFEPSTHMFKRFKKELYDWLVENYGANCLLNKHTFVLSKLWLYRIDHNHDTGLLVTFKNPNDAMLFKLTWG